MMISSYYEHIINNLKLHVMKPNFWILIKMIYGVILRPLVAEKIETSPGEIDDFVLEILDKIFDYESGN